MQEITIPSPPSTNHLYEGTGRNRHRSPGYENWINTAGWELNQMKAKGLFKKLGRGWYRTEIFIPVGDAADVDNRGKALHDLLRRMGITPDDKWLWGTMQERSHDVALGTCRVRFWTVEQVPTPLDT